MGGGSWPRGGNQKKTQLGIAHRIEKQRNCDNKVAREKVRCIASREPLFNAPLGLQLSRICIRRYIIYHTVLSAFPGFPIGAPTSLREPLGRSRVVRRLGHGDSVPGEVKKIASSGDRTT